MYPPVKGNRKGPSHSVRSGQTKGIRGPSPQERPQGRARGRRGGIRFAATLERNRQEEGNWQIIRKNKNAAEGLACQTLDSDRRRRGAPHRCRAGDLLLDG